MLHCTNIIVGRWGWWDVVVVVGGKGSRVVFVVVVWEAAVLTGGGVGGCGGVLSLQGVMVCVSGCVGQRGGDGGGC